RRYLYLTEDAHYLAIAIWIIHTHVFGRFQFSPRLVLEGPVRGCGKTTALSILELLCANPVKLDHVTDASLFRLADQGHTVLLDEVDNQGLSTNSALRSVMNSGHRRGGKICRHIGGQQVEFSTYAPLALGVIGKLPLPLLHRSIVIHMQRSPYDLAKF